jgi:hypothetical protein
MPKIELMKHGEQKRFYFICPGCNEGHAFSQAWTFNQDFDKPTVNPSVRVKSVKGTCHFYIREGKIMFLNDCWHELKGQTVEMLDV